MAVQFQHGALASLEAFPQAVETGDAEAVAGAGMVDDVNGTERCPVFGTLRDSNLAQ